MPYAELKTIASARVTERPRGERSRPDAAARAEHKPQEAHLAADDKGRPILVLHSRAAATAVAISLPCAGRPAPPQVSYSAVYDSAHTACPGEKRPRAPHSSDHLPALYTPQHAPACGAILVPHSCAAPLAVSTALLWTSRSSHVQAGEPA